MKNYNLSFNWSSVVNRFDYASLRNFGEVETRIFASDWLGCLSHHMHFTKLVSLTYRKCCIRTCLAIDKFCERRILEYTRLFLNETENVEKANPIIYALFCAIGIPANVLIIIGTAISHRIFDRISPILYGPCHMGHVIWIIWFLYDPYNMGRNM